MTEVLSWAKNHPNTNGNRATAENMGLEHWMGCVGARSLGSFEGEQWCGESRVAEQQSSLVG